MAGLWLPPKDSVVNVASGATMIIDATGEKAAFVGRIWVPGGGSKNISRVWFRFNTVTKASGSGLTVSLQDVDLANGPPYRPDGVRDQTVAIANGDAAFVSQATIRTGAFSAVRTVTHGDLVAVVVEFDGSGRLGSDTVGVTGQANDLNYSDMAAGAALFTTSWSASSVAPNVLFEFDDGSFGAFVDALPVATYSTISFNSGSTPDERALEFSLPFDYSLDGVWAWCRIDGVSNNFDFVLYDGTTPLATVPIDANALQAHFTQGRVAAAFPPVSLSANTTYRISVRPSSVSNILVAQATVASNSHFEAWPGGVSFVLATRTNAGVWTTTNTSRPMMGIRVSPASGGGGGGLSTPLFGGGVL